MQALVGPAEASLYNVSLGIFGPDTPMASDVGLEPLRGLRRGSAAGHLPRHPGRGDVRGAYYPLGHYLQPTAYRSNLTGLLEGFATFWSVRRG